MTIRHVFAALFALLAMVSHCVYADDAAAPKSLTIVPVALSPDENIPVDLGTRIAEVIGLQLERAGIEQLKIGQTRFSLPEATDLPQLVKAFGAFVIDQKIETEAALLAKIDGTPGAGITEIRMVVVNKEGKELLSEQAKEAAFRQSRFQPKDPVTAALFIVDRLGRAWNLKDPLRSNAPQGKMAERMRERSGIPSDKELSEIKARLDAVRGKLAESTVTVYPIHLWKGWDAAEAGELAKLLNERGVCRAEVSQQIPELDVKGDPNEQKVLWETARQYQRWLRQHEPTAEYALLADYGLSPTSDGSQPANHVHLILCDRSGQWVFVDFQNSHHADFQHIMPKTISQCNQLGVDRLAAQLSQ